MADEAPSVPARSGSTTVKTPKLTKKHAPRRLQEEKKVVKRKPLTSIEKKNVFKVEIDDMDINEEVDDAPSEPQRPVKRFAERKQPKVEENEINKFVFVRNGCRMN